MAIMPAAAGSVASPASNALIPNAAGSWKYRLSTYMSALIVPATIRIASVAPTSTRLRRRREVDERGARPALDAQTNNTVATTVIAKQPSVAAEAQPQSLPLLRASTSGARTSAISTVPAKSIERGAVRVARFLDGAQRQRDARGRDRRVDPEQSLPAGGVDEHTADQRADAPRRPPTPRPTA